MSTITLILNILLVISSIVMIVTVLMQQSDSDGMSAIAGNSETFFGKNKSKTLEGRLALITKISAVVFVLLAILLIVIK